MYQTDDGQNKNNANNNFSLFVDVQHYTEMGPLKRGTMTTTTDTPRREQPGKAVILATSLGLHSSALIVVARGLFDSTLLMFHLL